MEKGVTAYKPDNRRKIGQNCKPIEPRITYKYLKDTITRYVQRRIKRHYTQHYNTLVFTIELGHRRAISGFNPRYGYLTWRCPSYADRIPKSLIDKDPSLIELNKYLEPALTTLAFEFS